MAHERILQLEHEIRVAHRLHEANIQSLTADLNAAFIDADKKKERVADLEEQLDVQGNELKITQDHLVRIQHKANLFETESKDKDWVIEILSGQYTDTRKKLEHTAERLRVKTKELEYLKECLDTSFEAQCPTKHNESLDHTTDTSFEAQCTCGANRQEDTVQIIRTVSELVEAAKGVENSDRFLITVRRKDLPVYA